MHTYMYIFIVNYLSMFAVVVHWKYKSYFNIKIWEKDVNQNEKTRFVLRNRIQNYNIIPGFQWVSVKHKRLGLGKIGIDKMCKSIQMCKSLHA